MRILLPRAAAAAVASSTPSVSQNCGTAVTGSAVAFAISFQPSANLPCLATIGSTLFSNVW